MKAWIDFKTIRATARFEPVLEHYGLLDGAKREGKELVVRCPFHDDARPSLKVNPEKRVFHCFSCDAKGNVLDFVAMKEAVPLRRAAEILAEWQGIDDAKKASPPPRSPKKTSEAKAEESPARNAGPVNPPLTFTLKLEPDHPYLVERGVDAGVAAFFGLGYATRGVMKGRVCVPLHDEKGHLVAYLGRWPGEPPAGTPKHLLPPNFHKSELVFNLHHVKGAEQLVIVEGVWSVFRLQALGIPAVALLGRSLSPSQFRLLVESGAKQLSLLLDGDEPGRTAAAEMLPRLASRFFVRVLNLPDGGEPDTLAEEELKQLLA